MHRSRICAGSSWTSISTRERSGYHARGTFELVNQREKPLRQVILTGGPHWKNLTWTRDGHPYTPENRANLFVFTTADGALNPGASMSIGFEHEGTYPSGIGKRTASSMEFILPSSVVLTGFRPTVVPVLGYVESVGVDDDNKYDSREWADDFFEGQTDAFIGGRTPFTTKIRLTGPESFTLNSVGTKVEDTVHEGRRTVVWESEHPVVFFNVVGGRWAVERGEGTAVFYHPSHRYNIDEMRKALDAARRYYSEWFFPFLWRELKLSEFPSLATYAQGFPTNITFSEGVGFLTRSTPENHAAFEITAHESAHQWWGNILVPGKGPGGNVLSEGTSHFSTILLVEQVLGERAAHRLLQANRDQLRAIAAGRFRAAARQARRRPSRRHHGDLRQGRLGLLDAAQPHGPRASTRRDAGRSSRTYHDNPDHPVLQDFLAVMRRFADDPTAFDAFARQWFYEVVVPEYRIYDADEGRERDRTGR